MTRVRTREWSSTDYYRVLGVDAGAPPVELDLRYRELAKSLHPDRNADPEDQERFKRVSVAYSTLRDPSTRRAYDEYRSRVADGRLYTVAPPPRPASAWPDGPAPRRPRKTRGPMPAWLRLSIAGFLVALGLFGIAWALFGELTSHASADTPLAVQVTLVIMAVKFLACGAALVWYPQLRARWHH